MQNNSLNQNNIQSEAVADANCNSSEYAVDINTIPIVEEEKCILYPLKSKAYVYIHLEYDDKRTDTVEMSAERIESKSEYLKKFGAKPFSEFEEEHWDIFFEIIKKGLTAVEQIKVYTYSGWNNNSYIIGNFKITADKVEKIEKIPKTEVALSDLSYEEIIYSVNDIFAGLSDNKFIGYTMLLYNLLSHIKQRFFESKNIAPQFLLSIVGKTGSYKSSVAKAVFNSIGAPVCSFEDSMAAIRKVFKSNKSGITIVDDFKCNSKKNNERYEELTRMSGDITTASKRVEGNKVDTEYSTAMVVITGETRPELQQSSYSRIMFLDINNNHVNREKLTNLQNSQEEYNRFLVLFFQRIIKENDFDEKIITNYNNSREAFIIDEANSCMHGRYYEMYAWMAVIWDFLTDFMSEYNVIVDYAYKNELKNHILSQHNYYKEDPIEMFKTAFLELKGTETFVTYTSDKIDNTNFSCIEYESTFFFRSKTAFEAVCKYWKDKGRIFPCTERMLRKHLQNYGYLKPGSKNLTIEKVINKKSCSGFIIYKNLFLKNGGKDYD